MFVPITQTNKYGKEVEIAHFAAESFLTEDFAVNQIILEEVRRFTEQKPQAVKKVFYLFYDI